MNKVFGANWWTTLWGFITVAAGAIAVRPEIIKFLPESWQSTISGVSLFITVVAGGVFSVGVKSKNVTGGMVQQTADGSVANPVAVGGVSKSVADTIKAEPKV